MSRKIYVLCDWNIAQIIVKFVDQLGCLFVDFLNEYVLLVIPFQYGDGLLNSIFLMLYAFLIIFCIGHRMGNIGSSLFGISITFVALSNLSFYIWYNLYDFWCLYFCFGLQGKMVNDVGVLDIPVVRIVLCNWISCSTFTISWGFVFDPLSLFMMWVVLFITFVVQIYCLDYMVSDPFFSKFYAYLSIFSFFMLFLVASDNYLQIFVGWEGVGLISFMLISFWSTRRDAVFAGLKAMFVNRFGDLFFICAIVISLGQFGSLNFEFIKFFLVYSDILEMKYGLWLFSLSLVFAAMAKSAQLGLHMWLPDAMEGPTPVSALIHAATMVTAGIFVLIRASFILVLVPSILNFIVFIGGLTALFGASVACVQFDIKKVIAYSTCSQLGYMMIACGSGNFIGAFFHLVNHAFFKAALFLSAGSVIHAMSNEQDMRKMGALVNFLPITFVIMVFSSAALAGFPFLSGFYSKDGILEFCYSANSIFSYLGFIFGLLGAFCTSFYSFRLLYLVFLGPYNGLRSNISYIHESPKFMLISLVLLVVPSIGFGYMFSDLFIGNSASLLWSNCIATVSFPFVILPIFIKQIPTVISAFGVIVSYSYYVLRLPIFFKFLGFLWVKQSYVFLCRKWYFDDLLAFSIRGFMCVIFKYFWSYFEHGVLVYFGPIGLIRVFSSVSDWLNSHSTNEVRNSLVYIKSIFYFLFFCGCMWFIIVNFFEYLLFVLIIQIFFIFYYLFR